MTTRHDTTICDHQRQAKTRVTRRRSTCRRFIRGPRERYDLDADPQMDDAELEAFRTRPTARLSDRELALHSGRGAEDLWLWGGGATPKRLTAGTTVIIGRSPICDYRIDSDDVSRLHALVRFEHDGSITVQDLGSTNGTLIGDRLIIGEEPVELLEGEGLTLGSLELNLEPRLEEPA